MHAAGGDELMADGSNWVSGQATGVYQQGWTTASDAENYIARWLSPVDARFVRVAGTRFNGGDGNAQIDAIIAAVPEPAATLATAAAGISLLLRSRRNR